MSGKGLIANPGARHPVHAPEMTQSIKKLL